MKWYLEVMKKYAVFNGRSTRKEFWTFFLFLWPINFALLVLAIGNTPETDQPKINQPTIVAFKRNLNRKTLANIIHQKIVNLNDNDTNPEEGNSPNLDAKKSETPWYLLMLGLDTEANLDIIKISFLPKNPFSLIFLIFLVPHILPSVSLTIRRLHDTGNSEWWVLLSNGGVAAIIPYAMCLQDSQPEENKYGSNPKLEG